MAHIFSYCYQHRNVKDRKRDKSNSNHKRKILVFMDKLKHIDLLNYLHRNWMDNLLGIAEKECQRMLPKDRKECISLCLNYQSNLDLLDKLLHISLSNYQQINYWNNLNYTFWNKDLHKDRIFMGISVHIAEL